MVSTRQAVKARKSAGETFSPAGSGDEHEEGTPEPSKTRGTKRARTTKMTAEDQRRERRRKAAKLSMLPGMPVDILYEVGGSLLLHVVVDAQRFLDIFSRPPKRSVAHLLDGEGSQRVPYQKVIATYLAGLIRDDPGE